MKYNFIWLNRIHKIRYGIGICALFIFTSVNAQVTLNEKNQTIRSIIEQIEASGHYQFFYNDELVSLDKKVSVSIKDRPIEYVMDQLLAGTDITYKKEKDNLIVLTLKNIPSAPASTTPEEAQTRMIHGKVVDTTGEGIIGANVIEKGNKNGTVTDWNGNFSLSVSENSVLDISYIGYNTTTVPVKGQNTLYIVLSEDTQLIEEVVVTGFGLSQKKATLTGAISTIGAQDIGRSLSATTSGASTGKIAGLNFRQTDSRPGSNTKLQIRNMGDPLYIIDGVAKDVGQFNNIDFNDIESIAILKDASAAIYGVRAANGVIVVTTKKRAEERKECGYNQQLLWLAKCFTPARPGRCGYLCGKLYSVRNGSEKGRLYL